MSISTSKHDIMDLITGGTGRVVYSKNICIKNIQEDVI